jgi:PAS domain S-box-containing protein
MTRAPTSPPTPGHETPPPAEIGEAPLRCLVDPRGDLVEASDRMLRALGYRRDDRASLNISRLVDPIHLATLLWEQRASGGEPPPARHRRTLLVKRSGARIWADVVLRPVLRDDERLTEALIRLEDGRPAGRTPDLSRILDAMTRMQVQFIEADDPKLVFRGLLADVLDLTDSAFGLIGEVLDGEHGERYIGSLAQTGVTWDGATRDVYERTPADGMEYHDPTTLLGACLTTMAPVIVNDPDGDPRSSGLPNGHPPLRSFMGLPVVHGDSMVGIVGVANRPGGYEDAMVERLGPLLATAAGITDAYRERRRMQAVERELRERDRILRAIIEHAPEIIYLKDVAGTYVVFNPAGTRLRGLDPDSCLGRSDADIFPADEAAEIRLEDLRVMETRATRTYESTLVVDGRRRTFVNTKSPWLDDDGGLCGVIGITTEITERAEAEEALRRERELLAQNESLLQGIIVSAGEAIITSDLQGRIVSFNPAAESMFGHDEASVIGRPVEIIVPHEGRAQHEGYVRRRAQGVRGPAAGRWTRLTGLRSDGTTIPIEVFIAEVSRSDDRRIVALIRDLTEHVKIQEMKDDFVSVVSHELRTPLTSIQGALGLILGGAGGEVAPQARELIAVAHDNSSRLVRLTNDLLDLQKVDAGRMTYRFVVTDLTEVARRTIAAMEPLVTTRGVRLELVAPEGALFASVDPDRMSQVLTNLIGNAMAVSDPGATVTIRVVEEDAAVGIDVEDRGPGIAEADRGRVWEKFLRIESGAAARTHGTGIGLPLARALVEGHGGTLDFASQVGEGTTFSLRIPRRVGMA